MAFPNLPGVPALASLPGVAVLTAPVLSNLLDSFKPQWGVYDSTGKIKKLSPDSFLGVDYRNVTNLPSHPVEQGGFSTFNKVKTPYSITLRVTKSRTLALAGTKDDRKSFLSALESMLQDTNLYTIVTPEASYSNANMEDFDYKREAKNGAEIIVASLHFVEIVRAKKTVATTASSPDPVNTGTPSAQASVSNGMVQGQAATGTYKGT